MKQESLRELVQHPGWSDYLDLVEEKSILCFGEIMQLDPVKSESFIKFIELKAQIDALRGITYSIERRVAKPEDVQGVDEGYFWRLTSMFKKLWRG